MESDLSFTLVLKDDDERNPKLTEYQFTIKVAQKRPKIFVPVYEPPKPILKVDKINFNELVPKGEIPKPPVM